MLSPRKRLRGGTPTSDGAPKIDAIPGALRELIDRLEPPQQVSLALCLVRSVREAGELSPRVDKRLAEAVLALEAAQAD